MENYRFSYRKLLVFHNETLSIKAWNTLSHSMRQSVPSGDNKKTNTYLLQRMLFHYTIIIMIHIPDSVPDSDYSYVEWPVSGIYLSTVLLRFL